MQDAFKHHIISEDRGKEIYVKENAFTRLHLRLVIRFN